MMKVSYYIIPLMLIWSCTLEISTEADADLLNQTVDEFNIAFEKCDIKTLDLLTTEQYAHLNGSNSVISKTDWMAYLKKRKTQLKEGRLKITKYKFNERQMSLYEKSAFVTGLIEMEGVRDSLSFSRRIRVSHFWVKENGLWKRAGFHDTRVQ